MPLIDKHGSYMEVRLSSPHTPAPPPPPPPPLISLHVQDANTIEEQRPLLSWYRLAGLTCLILSFQTFWTILMAHGTPYLQSLGLSESLTSVVWMGGPVGATFLSPVLGAWSDRFGEKSSGWLSRFGRRKPFIVVGAVGVAVCLFVLAHIRAIAESVSTLSGLADETQTEKMFGPDGWATPWLVVIAVIWVYCLNFFVTSLQVGARSLIVDCVTTEQQKDASAWISRWSCSAAVYTFWLSSVDLPTIVPFLGMGQFQALAHFEILLLASTVPISLYSSRGLERRPMVDQTRRQHQKFSILRTWRNLYKTFRMLPPSIRAVFKIQLWTWNAWFPFLYYHTTWVGHLAYENKLVSHTNHSTHSVDADAITAARIGSFAAFLYALASLFFTIVLPLASRNFPYLTVERLWFTAHILFAALMFLTLFARTVTVGTVLVTFVGFSWAMTQWAPFSLLAIEISRSEANARRRHADGWTGDGDDAAAAASATDGGNEEERVHGKGGNSTTPQSLGVGAVLGLHNVVMGVPQILAGAQITALFEIFDLLGMHDKTGWALRAAGLSALGAIWSCKALLL